MPALASAAYFRLARGTDEDRRDTEEFVEDLNEIQLSAEDLEFLASCGVEFVQTKAPRQSHRPYIPQAQIQKMLRLRNITRKLNRLYIKQRDAMIQQLSDGADVEAGERECSLSAGNFPKLVLH